MALIETHSLDQVKRRFNAYIETLKELPKADESNEKRLMNTQKSIESYYYGDVRELLEVIEDAVYQLENLEPLLHIPERGYVRNNFRRAIRTLKGE
ncbi:hypothetical protein [Cohnella massiliensis]|uniref:hypothetical protein n=1 Tax=Cohnella massiliensis TaxID=1816691 RepID=UPI0009BBC6C5|nr:hypothetical protein [Cohnella massiliensis]